jgi:biopolymer transport protein ExbD
MTIRALIFRMFLLLSLSGCHVDQSPPLTITVYPSAQRCVIKDQPVECKELGNYLRDTLKVRSTRQIDVSLSGSDTVPKDDRSIDRIAELIRAAGYEDVRTWRFGL